jgi:hypothetical protein
MYSMKKGVSEFNCHLPIFNVKLIGDSTHVKTLINLILNTDFRDKIAFYFLFWELC